MAKHVSTLCECIIVNSESLGHQDAVRTAQTLWKSGSMHGLKKEVFESNVAKLERTKKSR